MGRPNLASYSRVRCHLSVWSEILDEAKGGDFGGKHSSLLHRKKSYKRIGFRFVIFLIEIRSEIPSVKNKFKICCQCFKNFFSLTTMLGTNKLECIYSSNLSRGRIFSRE
jgi:hypothetical protein